MDILKKQLGVILAYVILVVLLASAECAAENKTLVFVGNDSYPPISYQEGGKPKGLAIDIVRALGQRMGRQIDIRLMEWKVAQAMVAEGKADALCQLTITEPRKQIYDFSDQAHDLRFSIFVRTGKQGISDLTDLRGLQVAVITASVQHQYVMADSQIKFTLTANDLQGFQLLKDGKVDAVLADLWAGSYVLAEKMIMGIQTSGEPFAHLASALAVKKGNTALLAAINEGLRSLQADGTIERINEIWRPKEIIVQTREQAVRKTYSVFIGILLLLLVVGAIWLITLKREITARRRTEEVAKESHERLLTVLNGLDAIVYVADMETYELLFVNKFVEDLFGNIAGQPCWKFIQTGQSGPCAFCTNNKLLDAAGNPAGTYKWEYQNTTNGHWYDIRDRALRWIDGRIVRMEIATDITERKQAEETLYRTQDKLKTIYDSAPVMICIVNAERRILNANPAFNAFIAASENDLKDGHACGVFGCINALDDQRGCGFGMNCGNCALRLAIENTFKTGISHNSVEHHTTLLREGIKKEVTLLGSTTLIHEDDQNHLLLCLHDITHQKQAEGENRSLQERLQRSEKMEALGTLAGGVAHDLNNVLGIIVGYSEMVLEDTDKLSPNRKSLENVMNGGLKAAAIVEDLLTLARRGVPGRSILNINAIVSDCQKSPEFISLLGHHPSVNITAHLEPDLLNISGSAVHLGKSLYNLISNASEAMPKGGTVTIRTANQYLDKPIQGYDQIHSGDYALLSVSDTGDGISEYDLKRIFEPFYTKKIMGRSGTGLGLAVVWGTVKDHNGYINVQSEEGKGSTFTLYFPVTREDITTEAVAMPSSEYMGKGERILVVDDVKEQRDLAASLLTTLNYNVSSVSSGEGAVEHLKEQKVDLIVLDMIMDPGMDGLDTYRQVILSSPKQKAIIVSGFSESDRVKEARRLGVGSYLRKPYIKERLGVAVRKELERG